MDRPTDRVPAGDKQNGIQFRALEVVRIAKVLAHAVELHQPVTPGTECTEGTSAQSGPARLHRPKKMSRCSMKALPLGGNHRRGGILSPR